MTPYDLVVIGGGITGLGVARLAAHNGYSCVVLERGDLASGSSSASSHMLHGGLRYLEHGRFSLVREALAERAALTRMAPALARPGRFLVPIYRGDRLNHWKLRAGLMLYDWFAGSRRFSPHAMLRPPEVISLEPSVQHEELQGGGLYSDGIADDARLAIVVGRDAVARGAEIRTYTEVVAARHAEGGGFLVTGADRVAGGEQTFLARTLVNATGPWGDEVRQTLARSLHPGAPDPRPLLRPSRGVHLVYPALTRNHGLLVLARSDGRAFFVVPFAGHSLVGTTEVEVSSPAPPSAWRATVEEVRYLRAEVRRVLPSQSGTPPLAVTSGLRPLLRSDDDVGAASREHRVIEENGIVTIAGGKYTTFRVMARDVMKSVQSQLGRQGRTLHDPDDPLPAPIAAGATLERIAEFAVEHEFARRVEDVVRRRTTLWLEPDRGRVAAAKIGAVMARLLGWSPERAHQEFQSYDAALWEEESVLQRSREEG